MLYIGTPQLMMGYVMTNYLKFKMHLMLLTYRTSQLSNMAGTL
jgi:hypothetical protein